MKPRKPSDRVRDMAEEAVCTGLDDFTITSIRSMYRLRRAQDEEARRQKALSTYTRRGHATHSSPKRLPVSSPKKPATRGPPPFVSLERQLAESGRAFVVVNDIVNRRLCLELFYKLHLLRDIRSALREGRCVVLRSPLPPNEGSEHECRQALHSLYMACVDQCRNPAAPPLNLDTSCKCMELLMEPKAPRPLPVP
jgi:hypothetical protein